MFRFEKLDVWHKALEYANRIYAISRRFPDDEKFGLTSQMRRSAVSISSNIAEGSGRSSDKDFARFIEIGYSSLMECVSQTHIAKNEDFLQPKEFEELQKMAGDLSRMMSGLKNTLSR